MTASPRTKAAKREARRRRNQADRAAALRLKVPATIGLVAAAELAVEEEADERERKEAPKLIGKRKKSRPALDELLERGHIVRAEYDAGMRLETDWRMSSSAPRVTADYLGADRIRGNGDAAVPVSEAARIRFSAAMRAVGIECSSVVVHVCLIPQGGPYSWEASQSVRLPFHTGMRLLKSGLDLLARHYKLK